MVEGVGWEVMEVGGFQVAVGWRWVDLQDMAEEEVGIVGAIEGLIGMVMEEGKGESNIVSSRVMEVLGTVVSR
jgi:hypothetical protein